MGSKIGFVIGSVYTFLLCILTVDSIRELTLTPGDPHTPKRTFTLSNNGVNELRVNYSPGVCYKPQDNMKGFRHIALETRPICVDFFTNTACADVPSVTFDKSKTYNFDVSRYKSFKACGPIYYEFFPVWKINSHTKNMKQSFFLGKDDSEGIKWEYEHGTCNLVHENSKHFDFILLDNKMETKCVEFYPKNVKDCFGNPAAMYTDEGLTCQIDLTLYDSFKSCSFAYEYSYGVPNGFSQIFDSLSGRSITHNRRRRSLDNDSEFAFWFLYIFYTRGRSSVCNGLIPLYQSSPRGFIPWAFLLPNEYRNSRLGEGYEVTLNMVIHTLNHLIDSNTGGNLVFDHLYGLASDIVFHRTGQTSQYASSHFGHVCTNSNAACKTYLQHRVILSYWARIFDKLYRLKNQYHRLNPRDEFIKPYDDHGYVLKEFEKFKNFNLCGKN